ncbi:PREDICTED: uncharacterized protein LOC108974894 [Bactrocera latifrons]|uniref:Uncharacterized protein n=1 Tax=Bactrocera latifrons TaxID=174628 RepID=A0A0K8W7M5_BACLA|nr:PREDICTED: uncharacterized protein LOC108974894 [Bactrocera latifrons]
MQLTWSRLLSVSLLIAALTLETAASRASHRGANNNRYSIFRKQQRSVARDEDVLPSGRFITQNYLNSLKGQSTNNSCEETVETYPVHVTLSDPTGYFDDYDYTSTPVRQLEVTTFSEPESKTTTTPAPATSTTPAPAHNPVIIGFYDNYEYDDDDYDSSNDNYSSYSDDVDDNDEDDVSENDDDDLTAVNSKQRGFGNGHENSVSQPESDNANVGKAARQQSLSDYQRRRNRQRRRRIQRRRVPVRRRRHRNQRRRPQRLRLRRRPNRIRQQVVVRRRRTRTGGRPSASGQSIPLPNIPLPNFIRLPAKK